MADYNLPVRTFLRYFFLALLLLVVALISALTAMSFAIHGREVAVPDLRGKTPAEAHRISEDAGLAVQIESSYYNPSVPEGRVLTQMPAAGTIVRRGWEVRLALSLGPLRIAIPQVVGESERVAGITIAGRGLELGPTSRVQMPAAASRVIGQSPPANAMDISAPRISLLIAQDAPPQSFVMPSFIGSPIASVIIVLKNAGFSVGKVTVAAAPENSQAGPEAIPTSPISPAAVPQATVSPASIVISQDPTPGQKVSAGSAINFVVK